MSKCWYCNSDLIWQSDFNYDEIYGDGEGIISVLKCSNDDCDAEARFSIGNSDEY